MEKTKKSRRPGQEKRKVRQLSLTDLKQIVGGHCNISCFEDDPVTPIAIKPKLYP